MTAQDGHDGRGRRRAQAPALEHGGDLAATPCRMRCPELQYGFLDLGL